MERNFVTWPTKINLNVFNDLCLSLISSNPRRKPRINISKKKGDSRSTISHTTQLYGRRAMLETIYSCPEFTENKYLKWYKNIIAKAQKEDREKYCGTYFESHHIFPKSIFPDLHLDLCNRVLLTAKEHFVCHRLLVKFTEGKAKRKMSYALASFFMKKGSRKLSPGQYGKMKAVRSELMRQHQTGKIVSVETRERMSRAQKICKLGSKNPMYGKPLSEEHRRKVSEAHKGEAHHSFRGYYVTPFGTFSSACYQDNVASMTLIRWCKNNTKKISRTGYSRCNYLRTNFTSEIVGKSFADLGFDFEYKKAESLL